MRVPKLELIIIEALEELLESLHDYEDESLIEQLWYAFTVGDFRFITDRIVETLNSENHSTLRIAAARWIDKLIYLCDENDFTSKENFTVHYELIKRVLEEMQKPSHTARAKHYRFVQGINVMYLTIF